MGFWSCIRYLSLDRLVTKKLKAENLQQFLHASIPTRLYFQKNEKSDKRSSTLSSETKRSKLITSIEKIIF